MWSGSRLMWGVLAFALAHSALGAGLGDLQKKIEKKATEKMAEEERPDKPSSKNSSYTGGSASSFGSGTYPSSSSSGGSGFAYDFWSWLVAGPFMYRADDPGTSMDGESDEEDGWADDGSLLHINHQTGYPVVPYIRGDLNWQYIDSDNDAIDGRVELGYKMIGFLARSSKYTDSLQDLSQTINQYYGVVRYGGRGDLFPGSFEVSIGLGIALHDGDLSEDSSAALTIPLKYYPSDRLGFEFRPAWYKADYAGIEYNIGDYDLSASLGLRYLQVHAGYRWLWFSSIGHALNGPYAGISVSF